MNLLEAGPGALMRALMVMVVVVVDAGVGTVIDLLCIQSDRRYVRLKVDFSTVTCT